LGSLGVRPVAALGSVMRVYAPSLMTRTSATVIRAGLNCLLTLFCPLDFLVRVQIRRSGRRSSSSRLASTGLLIVNVNCGPFGPSHAIGYADP
jgi:hypothetical protein